MSSSKSFTQVKNAFRVYLKYRKYYPNKIRGFISHFITVFMPKGIVNILVKLNK